MDDARILMEVEDLARTMPPRDDLDTSDDATLAWLGRGAAVMAEYSPGHAARWHLAVDKLHAYKGMSTFQGANQIVALIQEVRYSIQMRLVGPQSSIVPQGAVFDYFDSLRAIIEPASKDILFVDPYLEAEFVARYLPHIKSGVSIRLLAREKMSSLMSAVRPFAKQHNAQIEVRSAPGFHDRFVFIDGMACYQSGGSFKDGAKNAPVTITQITDAFASMLQTYEGIWSKAKVET